nr:immunoglobulin heavy chain junction region [Mus musculus]NSM03818.1 immunoglobulin heavy chain junction region [Mus musculus]NSM03963.1 immunoglobulin heavy chain junction region [Mus musculus]NSM03992.1 immunoglobulin heavy chain junction region [Mus musculus]NSM04457.1 immunoglobulin heavy chain junction region [Mus musculus]
CARDYSNSYWYFDVW